MIVAINFSEIIAALLLLIGPQIRRNAHRIEYVRTRVHVHVRRICPRPTDVVLITVKIHGRPTLPSNIVLTPPVLTGATHTLNGCCSNSSFSFHKCSVRAATLGLCKIFLA